MYKVVHRKWSIRIIPTVDQATVCDKISLYIYDIPEHLKPSSSLAPPVISETV